MAYLLGIDAGTTMVKAALFDEVRFNFDEVEKELKSRMEDVQFKHASEKYIYDDIASVGLAAQTPLFCFQ